VARGQRASGGTPALTLRNLSATSITGVNALQEILASKLAERVGFEPTIPEDIPVFEFDRRCPALCRRIWRRAFKCAMCGAVCICRTVLSSFVPSSLSAKCRQNFIAGPDTNDEDEEITLEHRRLHSHTLTPNSISPVHAVSHLFKASIVGVCPTVSHRMTSTD